VADHRIWLVERVTGSGTSSRIASGRTGADGSVYFVTPPIDQTVTLRLATSRQLRSAAMRVAVTPSLSASVVPDGTSYSISVSVAGGNPGDTLQLQQRVNGSWAAVTTTQLDGSSDATFRVAAPKKRTARYRLILPATRQHGFGSSRFTAAPSS
jgi:hypothetical protein